MWVYGSGFPKSHDVSKAIDKAAGAEREVVGEKEYPGAGRVNTNNLPRFNGSHYANGDVYQEAPKRYATAPATPDAERWAGWGTALKPAWEPVIVARKPFPGTVAANVLAHGTGAINVDGCRVEGAYETRDRNTNGGASMFGTGSGGGAFLPTSGRWPANLVHDGSDEVLAGFPVTNGSKPGSFQREMTSRRYEGGGLGQRRAEDHGAVNLEKPGYPDTGSAARFFYCAKASRADRDDGLEGMEERLTGAMQGNITGGRIAGDGRENPEVKPIVRANVHPCVKPTPLMRWLCRLVTPPGGIVLDPFMGSGSTGKAAVLEGFSFVGVDREAEYVEIARRRIDAARLPLFAEVTA
jgi:site-specific DNA-methyltransferase (adenine-specific)